MQLAIRLVVARHRVGVAIVIQNQEGQVLLLHHVFHPYSPWGLPGGWLAGHESPEQCLARELQEETGLQVRVQEVIHVDYDNHPPHLTLIYTGYAEPGPIRLSAEISDLAWVDPQKLPKGMYPVVYRAIHLATIKDTQ